VKEDFLVIFSLNSYRSQSLKTLLWDSQLLTSTLRPGDWWPSPLSLYFFRFDCRVQKNLDGPKHWEGLWTIWWARDNVNSLYIVKDRLMKIMPLHKRPLFRFGLSFCSIYMRPSISISRHIFLIASYRPGCQNSGRAPGSHSSISDFRTMEEYNPDSNNIPKGSRLSPP